MSTVDKDISKMKKTSINKKVLYINLVLFTVLICQGIYSYLASSDIKDKSEQIKSNKFPAVTLVNELNALVNDLSISLENAIVLDPEDAYDLDDVDWSIFDKKVSEDSIFRTLNFYEAKEPVRKIEKALAMVDSIAAINNVAIVDSLKKQFPKFRKGYASILVPKIREVRPEDSEGDEDDSKSEEVADNSDVKEAAVVEEVFSPQEEIKKLFKMIETYKNETNDQISLNFLNINTKASTFFLISIGIFTLLVAILTGFFLFFRLVTKALVKLSDDANIIKNGDLEHKIVCERTDEVGTLQLNFDLMRIEVKDFIENLDKKVQERTREVVEEKKKISDLLNNMKQAVFKIDAQCNIIGPVSEYTNQVFGCEVINRSIFDIVYKDIKKDSEIGVAIKSSFIAVFGEDDLQWELSVDNLPSKINRILDDGKTQILKLSYAPLWDANSALQEIMYVVEDITELEALAEENRRSEQNIRMIQSIGNSNMDDLKNYFTSTASLIQATEEILATKQYDENNFALMFRNLHTIKGNSRIFTFAIVASATHSVENIVSQSLATIKTGNAIDQAIIDVIKTGVNEIRLALRQYAIVGRDVFKVSLDGEPLISPDGFVENVSTVKVLKKNFVEFENLLKSFEENDADKKLNIILSVFHRLYEVDVISSFGKYKAMVNEIAAKLNKKIKITISGDEVSMEKEKLDLMHDAIVHMIRNSADHGIESTEERLKAGKSEEGHILIAISKTHNGFYLKIKDDGAGIPVEKIYQKAVSSGVVKKDAHLSDADKVQLIFIPNLSAKDEVSDLSGRGVGMDVVKNNIKKIGGLIDVNTELGKGTEFVLKF